MKVLDQTTVPAQTRVAPLVPIMVGTLVGTVDGAVLNSGTSRTLESEQNLENDSG